MNYTIMNRRRLYLQWRTRLILMPLAMLFFFLSAQAQTDAVLPPIGGGGGGSFVARCPQGQLLTGFELRTGEWVDAIRLICVTPYGPADVGPPIAGGERFGGNGGSLQQLPCPRNMPIVTGMYVRSWGVETETVASLGLFCGVAATTQTQRDHYDVLFQGQTIHFIRSPPKRTQSTQLCPTSLVAVGINGRSGEWLDAVGLICGVPTLTPKAAPPPEAPSRPVVPAAAKVELPPGTAHNPPPPICDAAREARARNNPAAPGLEEKCRADLAAKGAAIAEQDAIVAEARAAETDVQFQQGFDIATGIFGDPALGAQGNTAKGPGSLAIRDSLGAAGQRGFNAAAKFHLSRTYDRPAAPAAGTIVASPNPVIVPNGQTSAGTSISWKPPQGYTYCEIYLSVDNGQWSEFARGGDGTKPTTIKLGSSQTFRMMIYEGQQGTPKIITTLTVTAPTN